jgi:tetratricopeptide (TPR) repeat protein
MTRNTINISLLFVLCLSLLFCTRGVQAEQMQQSDEEGADWVKALKNTELEPNGKENKKIASKDPEDTNGIDVRNPTELRTHADVYLKNGDVENAIILVEKAIELQPEDTDGRQIYADALEQKLKAQTERDPHTFNQCIKQWYFLFKNAEYPEMANLAAKHLKDLSGKSPYVWPTARMYLTRVLLPEQGSTESAPQISEEPVQIH